MKGRVVACRIRKFGDEERVGGASGSGFHLSVRDLSRLGFDRSEPHFRLQ